MLGTRYEEYGKNFEKLPFVLWHDLVITGEIYSREANWHDNLELQLCTSGKGTVMLDEKFLPFETGDIIVVNSTVLHHTDSPKMLKCDCLIIDTSFCKLINIDPVSLRFCEKINSEKLNLLILELVRVYEDTNDFCREAKLMGILLEILIELRENYVVCESADEINNTEFEIVKNAIKYIKENYANKLLVEDVAKNVFLNSHTLSRKFKKVTNQTIIEYINSYRCKRAHDYILDGCSVADAARMCGFTNMSFFTKTFKKVMGSMPSEYKKL